MKTYSTILSSTGSGKAGIFGIGNTVKIKGEEYTIVSAFKTQWPKRFDTFNPDCFHDTAIIYIMSYRFGKNKEKYTVFCDDPNKVYQYISINERTFGSIWIRTLSNGNIGYVKKINNTKYHIIYEFLLHGNEYVLGTSSLWGSGLDVLWYNKIKERYYKIWQNQVS